MFTLLPLSRGQFDVAKQSAKPFSTFTSNDLAPDELVSRLREALRAAQQTNRALEIEGERLRQRVRAFEAAIAPTPVAPGRAASFEQQIVDLTQSIAAWKGKHGRLLREHAAVGLELEQLRQQVSAQGRMIAELRAKS